MMMELARQMRDETLAAAELFKMKGIARFRYAPHLMNVQMKLEIAQ